jgi:hypothetical protein
LVADLHGFFPGCAVTMSRGFRRTSTQIMKMPGGAHRVDSREDARGLGKGPRMESGKRGCVDSYTLLYGGLGLGLLGLGLSEVPSSRLPCPRSRKTWINIKIQRKSR